VKILSSGRTGTSRSKLIAHTTKCQCGCLFAFEAAKAKFLAPRYPSYGGYVIECPECEKSILVDP